MDVPSNSVIKQLPPKDLRSELRLFIAGTSKPSSGSPLELVRKGFSLLKSLPASKEAVLEYFASFYEKSVANYLQNVEHHCDPDSLRSSLDQGEAVLEEIHLSLYNFISTNPFGWRFIIMQWSLDLLGSLSSKYADRGRAPVNGSLSDSLQQWLSCKATRSLIDINIHCLSLLESNESFQPIMYLLDTCVKHSPHFDWVVAKIGSTFPLVIISRVLHAGLQEFADNQGSVNTPKIKSVLDIMIHLAGCYHADIENSFKDIFLWSLDPNLRTDERGGTLEKQAAVPYLLTLASKSPLLLTSLCNVTLETMDPDIAEKMLPFGEHWVKFCSSRQSLLNLLIHLTISIKEKADEILMKLLLEYTSNSNCDIARVADEILGLLLKELDVLSRASNSKTPFLEHMGKNKKELKEMLISEKKLNRSSAVSLISFLGNQNVRILPEYVAHVLLNSIKDDQLDNAVKLSQKYKSTEVLAPAISKAIDSRNKEERKRLWTNLITLSKWEASGKFVSLPLLESVFTNLQVISRQLCEENDVEIANLMAELISKPIMNYSRQPRIPLLRAINDAIINFFYLIVLKSEGIDQVKGLKLVFMMMKKLCNSIGSLHRGYAVREIIESSVLKIPAVLFGAIPPNGSPIIQNPASLLEEFQKQCLSSVHVSKHSDFDVGVIGTGKRKGAPMCPIPSDKVKHNTTLLIQFLTSATESGSPQPTLEAVISVALLLVELVSPDVMYNGLPWPGEEFCKVTIERDLAIKRLVDNSPVIWSLLTFIAHHRPALCYCSVILRALLAIYISEWSACGQQDNPDLLTNTVKLVQLLSLGQLLPPPLTALSDVVPHATPDQVHLVLKDCVWSYLRDHVPSPALFTRDANGVMWRDLSNARPSKQYTETLRLVMLENIAALGPLFSSLFVQDQDEE